MFDVTAHPLILFGLSCLTLWLSGKIGGMIARKRAIDEQTREEFGFILSASLTLLGLIIGFSFSMAVTRYDQRKSYEEGEANAIGTEYLRADLLPASDAAKVRTLLKDYLDERILFYLAQTDPELPQINARTNKLNAELWSAVTPAAAAQPTPTVALAISGMNDVLNAQGYTQSAWWYHIPGAAWALMFVIAIGCNVLIGYSSRSSNAGGHLLFILPLVISVAFMLIADIESPRRGMILVKPQNLQSLADSLGP